MLKRLKLKPKGKFHPMWNISKFPSNLRKRVSFAVSRYYIHRIVAAKYRH
jgi:hypothetical protein